MAPGGGREGELVAAGQSGSSPCASPRRVLEGARVPEGKRAHAPHPGNNCGAVPGAGGVKM